MWFVWYMWMIFSGYVENIRLIMQWIISSSMAPVTFGNTQRESQCLGYWALISRHWMMVGFSFSKLDWSAKYWKPQVWSIVNGFPTPTKVEAPLCKYANGSEAKIYWPNSYAAVIGTMLYLSSNTRPDISTAVHQCDRFTHNTKASHETDVKRIYWYLQGTKENGMVFNPSK